MISDFIYHVYLYTIKSLLKAIEIVENFGNTNN